MRHVIALIGTACWALVIAFACPAEAKRVALVIGNADYKVGMLENPGNDASAVAEALRSQLKFDTVILKQNLGADAFRAALREMARAALGAEIGVIYFAGHGIEVGGRNFLIPVDARLSAARDADLEAIALETVLGQLDGVSNLKLVILDACRINPFALSGKRSVGTGLARIEPEGNTLVAYAAKDGTTAADGEGRKHSPFTEALLKHMATPGLEIRRLFGYVRDDVAAATARQQQPFLYGSLGGRALFLRPPLTPELITPPQLQEVERAWAAVKDTQSIAVLDEFRRQYGAANTLYDRLAEARIEDLEKQQEQRYALASPPRMAPPDLTRQLQAELDRVGCNPGTIDGVWGEKGRGALERFARQAKLSIATGEPTLAALEALKGQQGRICPLECGPSTVERSGQCVATGAPERAQPKAKAAPNAAPRPKAARRKEREKPGMCWAQDGRVTTILPCDDPRATIRAY